MLTSYLFTGFGGIFTQAGHNPFLRLHPHPTFFPHPLHIAILVSVIYYVITTSASTVVSNKRIEHGISCII